jgi:hypothetical protein
VSFSTFSTVNGVLDPAKRRAAYATAVAYCAIDDVNYIFKLKDFLY